MSGRRREAAVIVYLEQGCDERDELSGQSVARG